MSIVEAFPLVEALPYSDKFQLMQVLLTQLAREEGVSLEMGTKPIFFSVWQTDKHPLILPILWLGKERFRRLPECERLLIP